MYGGVINIDWISFGCVSTNGSGEVPESCGEGGSGSTTSPLLLLCLVALLSLLLYHFLSISLSLSLLVFSPSSNQSTYNRHYFSLSFLYQGKREAKTHESGERERVRFFYRHKRFCIFCFFFFFSFFFLSSQSRVSGQIGKT
jgi:hypothetical protein